MSQTQVILAIDQGTTGSTGLVFSADGRVLGRAYSEFTQHFPQPGWVEHDAEEIWSVTIEVAREALAAAQARQRVSLEGIGITNQRETVVLWDRETLAPVHRAIVWQDRRSAPICRDLKERGLESDFRRRTGLVLDPYFSGTKIRWILDRNPDLRRRAEAGGLAVGTIDSWLIARLTNGHVHATDPTNASRTLLYSLADGGWDPWLLDQLGVPDAILPQIRRSSGDFGIASGEYLGVEVPISGVAGDQQAALFGQGCWRSGLAKNTYGTGAFLLQYTGDLPVQSQHGLLSTAACDIDGGLGFALEGSVFVAGASIQWLRDGLGVLESAEESRRLAESLEGNDGVYLVPAFVGLGAPHWEPEARGTLFGLTRGTSRAHLVRAALEAMAYSSFDLLEAMASDSGVEITELRVDGGATRNDWLMHFQAGILGIPVRRPVLVETTALGAAGLAGIGVGVWMNGEEFIQAYGDHDRFEPALDPDTREELLSGWRRAVEATLAWVRLGDGGS